MFGCTHRKVLLLVMVGALVVFEASAMDSDLYFYVTEGQKRCFTEELPGETLLIGTYRHPDSATKRLLVTLEGPEGTVLESEIAEVEGRFAHHAEAAGEHRVCLTPDPAAPSWPHLDKTAKVHLRVDVSGTKPGASGPDSPALSEMAKRTHISSLEKELDELERKIALIVKDLEYSRELESHFRDQSERINSRVIWWSLFQTVALLVSGFWQVAHLKGFFRAKKLV